eukprot:m.38356 g.38356  ORF g.38356 m.38356 type:complete len:313 (+) comp6793_c0_seq1:125-1063(+)
MVSMSVVLMMIVVVAIATSASFAWKSSDSKYADKNRVLLTGIQSLTFSADRMSDARRVSPIPQLKCIGGSAHCNSNKLPRVMQCQNVGTDGVDVQWKCTAELDSDVKLGRTDVICEGYEYPDDPYILRGSCGVEYELDSTGQTYNQYRSNQNNYNSNQYTYESGWSFSTLLFYGMVAFVFYAFYRSCVARQAVYGNANGAQGVPPPSFQGGHQYPSNYGPNYGPGCAPPPPTYQQATYRPGFWSGLGLGGLMGSMWNRPRTNYGYGYGRPAYGARSGWFGSSGSGYSGSNFSPRSTGTTSHSSSGFGSTRRR